MDLRRRGPMRRLLAALVAAHRSGRAPLDVGRLFQAGWPGERALPRAAAARVYVTIRMLRQAGLGELLQTVDGGYRLHPGLLVQVDEVQEPGKPRSWAAPLVGREAEVERVRRQARAGARWFAITGPPAVGKSRLAEEIVAAELLAPRARTLRVSAAPGWDDEQVLASIDCALGGGEGGVASTLARKEVQLLWLDGLVAPGEVLQEACAGWLRELPKLRCLWTTSSPPTGAGVVVVPLSPLPPDVARDLFLALAEHASEKAARHLAARPGLLRELVHWGGRLPGVLELVAAQLSVLSPEELLEQLRQQDPSALSPLKASIHVHWGTLSPLERRLVARLAWIEGWFDLARAEAACRDVDHPLLALSRSGLFAVEQRREGAELRTVYLMPQAAQHFVRQYAEVRGAQQEAAECALPWYAERWSPTSLEERFGRHWTARRAEALRLRADAEALLRWAEQQGRLADAAGCMLALAVADHVDPRAGRLDELQRWITDASVPAAVRLELGRLAVRAAVRHGGREAAIASLRAVEALAEELSSPELVAAERSLVLATWPDEGRRGVQALKSRDVGPRRWQRSQERSVGIRRAILLCNEGRFEQARATAREVVRASRRLGDAVHEYGALVAMAAADWGLGRIEEGLRCTRAARALAVSAVGSFDEALAWYDEAVLLQAAGRPRQAMEALQEVKERSEAASSGYLARPLVTLTAKLEVETGHCPEALVSLEHGEHLFFEGDHWDALDGLFAASRAWAAAASGEEALAAEWLDRLRQAGPARRPLPLWMETLGAKFRAERLLGRGEALERTRRTLRRVARALRLSPESPLHPDRL